MKRKTLQDAPSFALAALLLILLASPAFSTASGNGTVIVRATDLSGNPIDKPLSIQFFRTSRIRGESDIPIFSRKTNESAPRVSYPPASSIYVLALAKGYVYPLDADLPRTSVSSGGTSTVTVRLEKIVPQLNISFSDRYTGARLMGVRVDAYDNLTGARLFSQETDIDGFAYFGGFVGETPLRIVATKRGYVSFAMNYVADEGTRSRLGSTLMPERSKNVGNLSIVLSLFNRTRLSSSERSIKIELLDFSGTPIRLTSTATSNIVRFLDIEPGKYTVLAYSIYGGGNSTASFEMPLKGNVTLPLRLGIHSKNLAPGAEETFIPGPGIPEQPQADSAEPQTTPGFFARIWAAISSWISSLGK